MAKIGCKYPCFAPIATEPAASLPTYSSGAVIGSLVSANRTVQLASGKLYGDDDVVESIDEFMSGNIAMDTDDMEDAPTALIYGCAVDSGEVVYNKDDTPPYGGLAFYKTIVKNGVRKFQCYFYPKVKAILGNDNVQTKGNAITFQNTSTSFEIFKAKNGDWLRTETFTTEAAAIAWVQSKIAVATWYVVNVLVSGSGISADKDGKNYVAAGEDLVITVTGTPTSLFDNSVVISLTDGAYTVSEIAADHEVVFIKTA